MMNAIYLIFAVAMGAAFGSFACCQAWRMRLKEEGKKNPGKRSVCLSCGEKLKWYENLPILSWVLQRGRCRKCGAKIGAAEILAEVLGAVSFGLIAWKFLSVEMANYVAMLLTFPFMVGLIFLAVYDGKWGELPTDVLVYTVIAGGAYAIVEAAGKSYVFATCPEGAMCIQLGSLIFNVEVFLQNLLPVLLSVALLAGTYYLLYFFSKERLVGGGDWILCLGIALVLGDWRLALVELFLANFLGSIFMLPKRKKRVAFGPFLVVAFVLVFSCENFLLSLLSLTF